MDVEYMPEYRAVSAHRVAQKLSRAKWGLIVMAAACFFWTFYMFVTPSEGGAGFFMITPVAGPAGLVAAFSWCAIMAGAASALGCALSRSAWVLGWTEPVLSFAMLLAGLYGIYEPTRLPSFNVAYTVIGVFLALYVAAVAVELYRRGERFWYVELAVAFVVFAASLAGGLNGGVPSAQVPFACVAFFVAAWGFVYGAVKLYAAPEIDELEGAAAEVIA